MSALTETELRAIEARAEAATPGPWRYNAEDGFRCMEVVTDQHAILIARLEYGGSIKPEANTAFIAAARHDIPRLAAAVREAWADGKRLQDEVAALDAARREAEAEHEADYNALLASFTEAVDAHRAAEAAAAAMREALGYVLPMAKGYAATSPVGNNHDIVAQAECTLASPPPGAALLAERDRLREALEEIANPISAMRRRAEADGMKLNGMAAQLARDPYYLQNIARAAIKETSNG